MLSAKKQPVLLPFGKTIYQHVKGQKITEDSASLVNIVLNNFESEGLKVLDIGSGTGVIAIMLSHYRNWQVYGFELQKQLVQLAEENNKLSSTSVKIIEQDIRVCNESYREFFDLIVSNPPYYKTDGRISPNVERRISRLEETCTPDDLFSAYSCYLTKKGCAYAIYPQAREKEITSSVSKHGFQIVRIHNIVAKAPKIVFEINRI